MCLYSKNKEPFIAKEDIVCYKILVKTKIPCVYKTPIIRTKVIKIPFFKKLFKAEGSQRVIFSFLSSVAGMYEVSGGFIHTYKEIEHAKFYVNGEWFYEDECVIFKCIIPKGTHYYESETEYASEGIKILGKVKVNFLEGLTVYI